MKRVLLSVILAGVGLCGNAIAQAGNGNARLLPVFREPRNAVDKENTESALNLKQWVNETYTDFLRVRPASVSLAENTLKATVMAALEQTITQMTDLGFSKQQATHAVFSGWVELSINRYDKSGKMAQFTAAELVNYVAGTAEVTIVTQPDEAMILIDDRPGYGLTRYIVWLSEGKHRLLFTKKGYKPLDVMVEVEARKTYTINRKMQPVE